MNFSELLFGILLVLALLAVAAYFIGRQLQTLQALRGDGRLAQEDRGYLRGQVRRRLICSVLMVLFAGFLVGWFFIEKNLPEPAAAEDKLERNPAFVELVVWYWAFALFTLLGILILAAYDFFATARYGLHQKKLLDIEHRAQLEIEAARLRKEREQNR